MRIFLSLMVAGLLGFAGAALADTHCALSYEAFEQGIPHTDLEECPTGLKGPGKFCRYSVVAEIATVFVFDEDSSCLVTTKAFYEDDFVVRFK